MPVNVEWDGQAVGVLHPEGGSLQVRDDHERVMVTVKYNGDMPALHRANIVTDTNNTTVLLPDVDQPEHVRLFEPVVRFPQNTFILVHDLVVTRTQAGEADASSTVK